MTTDITEADWKVFTKIKSAVIDRLCKQALARVTEISGDARLSDHERFLAVFEHTRDVNKELNRLFDGHTRSRARLQLYQMFHRGLLTPEDLSRLSAPLRAALR